MGLTDYEKVFCATPESDIFDLRQINREEGCIVLVRPDQYIASVLPLGDRTRLTEYFTRIMLNSVSD